MRPSSNKKIKDILFYLLGAFPKNTHIEIFLHELSHAVDDRLNGLKAGQHKDQEVTAEFSAAVIAHLMGYKIALGNVREYIEHYSFRELMTCLARIEKIVSYVVERTATGVKQPVVCSGGRV